MLRIISLLFFGALVRPSDSISINSSEITNWGTWHNMEYCPPKMYAVGVQLKVDEDQVIDKTGLNAVALYCNPLDSSLYTNKHPIMSGVGPFGNWQNIHYCPQGTVGVGFYLDTEKPSSGDQIGATDFTLLCGDPFGSRDPSSYLKFDAGHEEQFRQYMCPQEHAVRGIRTQVENSENDNDNTALNNIELDCHKVDITCIHEFITLLDYSNSGSTPVLRSYTERISHTRRSGQTQENSGSSKFTIGGKVSIDVPEGILKAISPLTGSINLEIRGEYEKITRQNLRSMVEHTLHHEKEETVEIQISPKTHTIIKQLHIVCGNYRLGLPKIVREEYSSSSTRAGSAPLLQESSNFSKIGQNTRSNSRDETSFYLLYESDDIGEGKISLFNSFTSSVEKIAKFHYSYLPYQVATIQSKIFGIRSSEKSFEIYDLNTRQTSKGPDPPEWRSGASVAHFKDKLYYLGGEDPKSRQITNRVDVLIDGIWQTGPKFSRSIRWARAITCDGILYVIDGRNSGKIYRLSDDEREWIKIGKMPERRRSFGVASLNGKIYITGGWDWFNVFKSCLCFDPSAPDGSRISRIAAMNYVRHHHSLVVANGKLYAIGGFQKNNRRNFCNSIEEYDPQKDEWREVGRINSHKSLFQFYYWNGGRRGGRICLFNSSTHSVEEIAKFHNYYWPYQVTTTQNKMFAINYYKKSFEIFDLNTRQISRGPDPPKWREYASVAYFKGKLYYLGGEVSKIWKYTNRVDILIDGKWETGPAFPLSIERAQTITCDGILYIIDGWISKKIYRLSDDEREWIKIGEIPEKLENFGVASLNGKIYIIGGENREVFKSCLCFDPSAPDGNQISRIADMNYKRHHHSLIVANGKLYAIGGFRNVEKGSNSWYYSINLCDVIEEYDPQTNKWRKVGKLKFEESDPKESDSEESDPKESDSEESDPKESDSEEFDPKESDSE